MMSTYIFSRSWQSFSNFSSRILKNIMISHWDSQNIFSFEFPSIISIFFKTALLCELKIFKHYNVITYCVSFLSKVNFYCLICHYRLHIKLFKISIGNIFLSFLIPLHCFVDCQFAWEFDYKFKIPEFFTSVFRAGIVKLFFSHKKHG